MNFGFLWVGKNAEMNLCRAMVESIRQTNPGAVIYQLTDFDTPCVAPVDVILRSKMNVPMMSFKLSMVQQLPEPMIIIDTDMIVQNDLSHIFNSDFDVALTKRYRDVAFRESGKSINDLMPYNAGIMFSKNRDFWKDCHEACLRMSPEQQKWWGEQLALAEVVKTGKYKVLELPGETYNYSPDSPEDDTSDKACIHYKGERKLWMGLKYKSWMEQRA